MVNIQLRLLSMNIMFKTKFCGDPRTSVSNLRMISSLSSACLVWPELSPLLAMHLSFAPCMPGTRYSLMSRLRWPSEDRPSTSVLLFSFTSSRLMVEGGSTSWPTQTTDTAWETFEVLTSLVKQLSKKVKVERKKAVRFSTEAPSLASRLKCQYWFQFT